jgi:regulator of protease activity HflC (stomatin/prohibitin superfamily)
MTDEHRPEDESAQPVAPRREASVTLRRGLTEEDTQSRMFDPANQSAAEALRFSYHLLLGGIAILVVLFFLSGVKTIDEGRVGIRLTAGKIVARNLQPGMRWSWPQPIGEILTFYRNPPRIELREAFYPSGKASDPTQPLETLAMTAGGNLDPRADGSLITGDLNLAHAQWVVQYSRHDVDDFAQNVNPEYEDQLVRMAVQRGAVHAVAGATLDDVIKPSGQAGTLVSERARLIAQEMLDKLGSGLRIELLDIQRATVPLGIFQEWATMAGKDAEAAKTIDEARSEARRTINEVAGAAAPYLIEQIDAYERAVELEDVEEADRLLADIYRVLDGDLVEVEGRMVQAAGSVTRILDSARRYRTTVASRERARLNKFRAVEEQYKTNPVLVLYREWADAYRELRSKPFVQMLTNPTGDGPIQILMTPDPEIMRQMQMDRTRRENQEAHQRRLDELANQRLRPKNPKILSAEPD